MKKAGFYLGFGLVLLAFYAASCTHRRASAVRSNDQKTVRRGLKPDTIGFRTLTDTFAARRGLDSVGYELSLPIGGGNRAVRDSLTRYVAEILVKLNPGILGTDTEQLRRHTYHGPLSDPNAVLDYYKKEFQKGFVAWANEVGRTTLQQYLYFWGGKTWESAKAISYGISVECYFGGAHPEYLSYGATFRKSDGKRVQIIDAAKVKALQKLMREALSKQYFEDSEDGHVLNELDEVLYGPFIPLPREGLYLQGSDVIFEYAQGEICPDVYGLPFFSLPYRRLRPFMTREALDLLPPDSKTRKVQ